MTYLRTTFGVARSEDGAKTFSWMCEDAMGFSGSWDPPLAVAPIRGVPKSDAGSGTRLYVGLQDGVSWSDDDCSFTRSKTMIFPMWDLTVHEATGTVFGVSSAKGQFTYAWRAVPGKNGGDFERLGGGVDGVVALTIDVAPSNVQRVYMTAQSPDVPDARLFASKDGGVTFKQLPIPFENEAGEEPGRIFIAAVDPKDDARFFVRRLSNKGSDLWLLTEGGLKRKRLLRMQSAMFGFAKSADGSEYWAASGLPRDGVWHSADRGEHWQHIADFGVTCLHAAGAVLGPKGRLYACNNTLSLSEPTLSGSSDHGKTFSPLGSYGDISGPRTCDRGVCAKAWPAVLATLGRGTTSDGGADGAAPPIQDGGAVTPPHNVSVSNTGPTTPGTDGAPSKRCGCASVGSSAGYGLHFPVICLWLAALARGTGRRRATTQRAKT